MSNDRPSDRDLGMGRRITRRDFIDGVLIGAGAVVAGGWLAACTADGSPLTSGGATVPGGALQTPSLPPYPPELTGLRGQIDSAAAVPHMLRDGTFWDAAGAPQDTGETYDLVIVGGGISGLSAAYFARQRDPDARVLVLDNHDDFGGHARRNEFTDVEGRDGGLLIGYGGTEAIETPSVYSSTAMGVLLDLGIDVQRFHDYYDNSFWANLDELYLFGKEQWGRNHVAIRRAGQTPGEYLRGAPMAYEAISDLDALITAPTDYWAGRSAADKQRRLAAMTYADYLADIARVHPDAVSFLSTRSSDWWGYGIDGVGAIDGWASGYPGFAGLGISKANPSPYNSITIKREWDATDPYIFHFPEGNAAIARMLVRRLVPGSMPGTTMEDEVLARMDYGALDAEGNAVRIRLGSPVVKVAHVGDPAGATEVEVTYVRDGALHTVRGGGAVMACWYTMVPYLVDGLPRAQAEAARSMSRIPLVYATVQLRSRAAFANLGTWGGGAVGTGAEWVSAFLDYPVSMGGYAYPMDLDGPGLVHMTATPTVGGMSPREGAKLGRTAMLGRPFEDYERSIRTFAARAFGEGGLDPANDIQAITINRWAHGYSFEYAMPWDAAFYPDGPLPGEVAAAPFGRITFANTDRSSRAYTDSAIDAAYAAIHEQPG